MASTSKGKAAPKSMPTECLNFAEARGRPALFLFTREPLDLVHAVRIRLLLKDQQLPEADLVINSSGGSIHAAYQISEILRMHIKQVNACVPFYAKSAATLICIAADTIVLDELAQLGPLDTQILEEKKGGKGDYVSALNPFKTLEQLQKYALETLDVSVKMMAGRSGMSLEECIQHATSFVRTTTEPLFSKLDAEKLGEYSRALSLGKEYGDRLLRRSGWDEEKREKVLEKLVHGYPSHDFIIDYQELQELGFKAELFKEAEKDCIQPLFNVMGKDETFIQLVPPKPKDTPREAATTMEVTQ
jgi:hypothetical protein